MGLTSWFDGGSGNGSFPAGWANIPALDRFLKDVAGPVVASIVRFPIFRAVSLDVTRRV